MKIADLKSRLDILEVAQDLGIEINPRSKKAHCPFHDDKTPSLHFSKEKQIATCFSGNCDAGSMDVINLVEKKLNLNTAEALKYLKQQNHLETKKPISIPKTSIQTNRTETLTAIFEETKNNLQKSQKAKDYLASRNLTENLEVGYFTERQHQKWTAEFKTAALEIGILNQYANKNYGSNFKNCIIFPMKNCQGQIVSLYGRSITGKEHRYLKGSHQGLYPNYSSKDTKTLILTESIIDAASLLINDEKHTVLALYGTNGLTAEHTEAVSQLKDLEEIIFLLDADEAGEKAAKTNGELLHKKFPGIKISEAKLPEGEDINSVLESHEATIVAHVLSERKEIHTSILAVNTTPLSNELNTQDPKMLTYPTQHLHYTVLGGIHLDQLDTLRVTLRIKLEPSLRPQDHLRHSLDLYNDDQVSKLLRKITERLNLSSSLVSETLSELILKLEDYRINNQQEKAKPKKPPMSSSLKQAALQFLQQENLLKHTNKLIGATGLVGEEKNRMLMYLVFTSRLRTKPLHIISLGSSGTGKTYLQEKVSALIPEEQKLEITALTENAFYYFERTALKQKLILIEDLDGAEGAQYAIRELQSKRSISKTVALKDNKGRIKTETFIVEGPISLAGTTTKEKLYEDNANRCLLIYLDNSKKQQEAIMSYQRKASAGLINHDQEQESIILLQAAQELLSPIKVVNPYAQELQIPQEIFKPLRTNDHYLSFIETITFYKQHSRSKFQDSKGRAYIKTSLEDIEEANELLADVLLSKSDELTKACRIFLERLEKHVEQRDLKSFYGQDIRNDFRLAPSTCKRYLKELRSLGYLKVASMQKHKGFEYELLDRSSYKTLKNRITDTLNTVLEQIKQKSQSSVAQ